MCCTHIEAWGFEMDAGFNWSACRKWHELLDGLCTDQGYLDNMALADQLCSANGNQTQAAFDATLKNLQNWRRGAHVPQRRNFALLGNILKVDHTEGLREHWNQLYIDAKEPRTSITANRRRTHPPMLLAFPIRVFSRHSKALGAAILAIFAVAAFTLFSRPELQSPDADVVASDDERRADYVRNVSAKVGDALIIHGARGRNCGQAPDWENAKKQLPELETGVLSDGDIGTRFSRQCGGRVPARAILFTATTPGIEQIALYGDPITITVR